MLAWRACIPFKLSVPDNSSQRSRSGRPEVFCKKSISRNFAKYKEKTCTKVSLLIELQATLLKQRLRYRCFPVDFAKFLRTPPIL